MRNDNEFDNINDVKYENEDAQNDNSQNEEYMKDSNKQILITIPETEREQYEDNNSNGYDVDSENAEKHNNSKKEVEDNESVLYNSLLTEEDYDFSDILDKFQIFPNENIFPPNKNFDTHTQASTENKTPRETLQKVKIYTDQCENYDGEVDENFVRNGYGIYEFKNGDIYEGEFQNGIRNGEGEYTYFDGSIYRGNWLNDKKHGRGTFKFDKYEFDGEWENDFLKEGFTYRINQFDECNSFNSEESKENSESRNNSSNSLLDESFKLDHNKMDDPAYLRNFVNENYRILQKEKFKIDIELLNIKSQDSKIIMSHFPIDKLSTKFNKNNINFPDAEDSDFQSTFDKPNFNCHFKKISGKSLIMHRLPNKEIKYNYDDTFSG